MKSLLALFFCVSSIFTAYAGSDHLILRNGQEFDVKLIQVTDEKIIYSNLSKGIQLQEEVLSKDVYMVYIEKQGNMYFTPEGERVTGESERADYKKKDVIYLVRGAEIAVDKVFVTAENIRYQVKGKKSYGYLTKALKKQVDEIVDQMERLPVVNECYQKWWDLQCRASDFYSEKERQRPPLSQQKEFRAIKNAVIREAERIRQNQISFEDRDMEDGGGWVDDRELTWACWELRGTIENEKLPLAERDAAAAKMEQLAQTGDAYAQYFLGLLYRDGGLLIPDTEKAKHWLERAAKQEVHAAQYALGRLFLSDDPDVHDPSEGIRWMKAAAQNGNDYAAYILGEEYLSGKHVVKNSGTAAEYMHQAAQADNPWAQYLMGKLYLMGEGVEQDEDTAYEWFQAAAEQGHTYAQFFVDRMEQQGQLVSPSLLLSATRLLHHMGNIFRDSAPQDSTTRAPHIERKRLQKLRAKKIALGHKPDDYEEEQTMDGMTMGGW